MIQIKVTNERDIDSNDTFKFQLDHISVGMTKCSHLTIYDTALDGKKLNFNIKNEFLYISSNDLRFNVNGCDFYGSKRVKKADIIKIGSTEINIIGFERDFMSTKELSERLITNKEKISKEKLNLIELIEDEIYRHGNR